MCEHLNINGSHVIICGTRRKPQFCSCGRVCDFLCDWKMSSKKSGTCDAPICAAHAKQVAPEKHLCQVHQRHYEDWKRRNPAVIIPEQPSLFQASE